MAPFGDRGARRPIDLVVFNGTRRTVHVHSGDNLAIKVLSSESCSTNASSNTVTLVEAGGQPAEIKLYTKRFRCKARKLDVPASCTCLVYQQVSSSTISRLSDLMSRADVARVCSEACS